MKKFLMTFLFLLSVNFFVPFLYCRMNTETIQEYISGGNNESTTDSYNESGEMVQLFDSSVNSVINVPLEEYLANAAACEMPAVYEEEAIKAQMVAIHSYYLYYKEHPADKDNPYITVDSRNMKGYTDKNRLNQFWGSSYYDYYDKFKRCADEVKNQILTHSSAPALTPYYAVSCGKTADSRDIWGEKKEYLVSVDSSFDGISDDYLTMKQFGADEMYTRLKTAFPQLEIDQYSPQEWFGETVYYDSGYAEYVTAGSYKIPGDQFRDALGLKSSCVMIFWEDEIFSVATKGYGHGVGMSQFGANQLSQQGKTYSEILRYYYPGTVMTDYTA